jgi:hypothetical protein
MLINDSFDDEVVYLARSKQDQAITNIREISKKRFKLTGRHTLPPNEPQLTFWDCAPSMTQI